MCIQKQLVLWTMVFDLLKPKFPIGQVMEDERRLFVLALKALCGPGKGMGMQLKLDALPLLPLIAPQSFASAQLEYKPCFNILFIL